MPETPIWHPCQGAEAIFPTYPVVALCLPPANFSNRFAVKHTIHNDILHITMLAIDIPRALNLSMNLKFPISGMKKMREKPQDMAEIRERAQQLRQEWGTSAGVQ